MVRTLSPPYSSHGWRQGQDAKPVRYIPRRWDKLGIVTEVKQFHQYWVRMLGLGCASIRNRKFLHKCSPSTYLVVPAFQNFSAPPVHTTLPDQVVECPSIPVPAYIPDTTRIVDPPTPPSPQSPASATEPQQTPSSPMLTPPRRRYSRKCVLDHQPTYKDKYRPGEIANHGQRPFSYLMGKDPLPTHHYLHVCACPH